MALDTHDQPAKADTLKVPGANLHYEVRGSGPVLLLIPGAPADAGMFAGIIGPLAETYTVVTFDLRGLSRSSVDGPPEDQRVQVQADDAHRLLEAIGTEPAYVLGVSGGALVGLDLAARHPEQVHTLVAHEPPAAEVLPDNARWRAFFQEVYDTYRTDGAEAAMRKFGEGTGLDGGPEPEPEPQFEPSPEMMELMARMGGNIDFFFTHVLRPVVGYLPDVATLRAARPRVIVAVGEASHSGQMPYDAAVALAEQLGTGAVGFPGDHGGFTTHSEAFIERLHKVLLGG